MTALKKLLHHDAGTTVQLFKYAVAGGLATSMHIAIFFLVGWFIFPCLTSTDPLIKLFDLTPPMIDGALRARHAIYNNAVGFTIANFVAYTLNRRFVFRPGRHHWLMEMGLFYAVSGISLVVGTTLMGILIGHFGVDTTQAFGMNVISALLINYVARKFLIFHG